MPQAALSLPRPTSAIEALFAKYLTADAEKRRVYALADQAADADLDAPETVCDAAYDAVESVADAILSAAAGSLADYAIRARVLLARGADPADLFHYRPEDLIRFIQEVSSLARL